MAGLDKTVLAWSVLLLLSGGCREVQVRVVAEVAGKQISVEDFNAMARKVLGDSVRTVAGDPRVRVQLLDLFIGKELLVVEGEARHLDQDIAIAGELQRCERELLIQAVYDREVFGDRIEAKPREIAELYREWGSGQEVRASHILCPTAAEAQQVLAALKGDESFEELAQKVSTHKGSAVVGGDMGYMRRDLLLAEFRDQIWGLGIGDLYPQPLKSRLGFHVVKVTGRRTIPLDSLQVDLRRELERRKREARKGEYAAVLKKRYQFKWHDEVARALAEGGAVSGVDSAQVLAEWQGGQLRVAEYLRRIHNYGVEHTLADTARARERGERVTFDDLLVAEARRRGYDRDREIMRPLEENEAKLLAERLFAIEVGAKTPVTDEAVHSFYAAHRENYRMPPSIVIQEILVDERQTADSLKSLVLAGADMADLAKRCTKRSWARDQGGIIGPLTERTLGYGPLFQLGLAAADGELQGPVETGDGFSIFRTASRSGEHAATFEEAKDAVRTDMLERGMDRFIASLRTKYAARIEIDEAALKETLK